MKQRKKLQIAKVRSETPGPWGDAVQRLRLAYGWTRAQTAAAAGITPTTYGLIERGRHTQTSVLAALAAAFGVPITQVLTVAWIDPAALVAQPDVEAHVAALLGAVQRAKLQVLATGGPLNPAAQTVAVRVRRTVAVARARPGAGQQRRA